MRLQPIAYVAIFAIVSAAAFTAGDLYGPTDKEANLYVEKFPCLALFKDGSSSRWKYTKDVNGLPVCTPMQGMNEESQKELVWMGMAP